MADQTDDATAQLLALQQHEEHEREYESCRRQRSHRRTDPGRKIGQTGHLLRLDDHRFARIATRGVSACGLLLDLIDRFLNLLHGAAAGRAADIINLLSDVRAISRQLAGEFRYLRRHAPSGEAKNGEDEHDGHEDRQTAPDSPLEKCHRRREYRT